MSTARVVVSWREAGSVSCGSGSTAVRTPSSCSKFSTDPCAERSSGESLSFTSSTSNVLWEETAGIIVELSVEVVAVVGREGGHVGSEMAHDKRLAAFEERMEAEERWGGR